MLFALCLLIGSTPEQGFFDWSDLAFPRQEYEQRRGRMIEQLQTSGGGVFLVPARHGRSHGETFRQRDDFLYFTGLEVPDSVLVIDADHKTTTLFMPEKDSRFENPGRPNDFPGRTLLADAEFTRRTGIKEIYDVRSLAKTVRDWVTAERPLRINAGRRSLTRPRSSFVHHWSAADGLLHHLSLLVPTAKTVNAFEDVARLRMIKSPAEIEWMRRTCRLAADGIATAAQAIRPGVSERGLEAVLEAHYRRGGSQRLAFASIIKSGPNSLWPWRILASHYNRRNRVMHAGELVIFDVGCELNYYVSDVGRTFPVSGKFTAEQRDVLEMQLAVIDAVIAAVKPGVTFPELQKIAVQKIPAAERPYMQAASFFGHHIGMETGDPSLLEAPLAPGMVFTVEPWYYNHDRQIAVFIEDNVLVTADGSENLTASLPRTPDALEKLITR